MLLLIFYTIIFSLSPQSSIHLKEKFIVESSNRSSCFVDLLSDPTVTNFRSYIKNHSKDELIERVKQLTLSPSHLEKYPLKENLITLVFRLQFEKLKFLLEDPYIAIILPSVGVLHFYILCQENSLELVRFFISRGCIYTNSFIDRDRYTPFMASCYFGYTSLVELFLSENAKLDTVNEKKVTALMLASGNGQKDVVNLLLEHQAKINEKSVSGWTALMLASQNGHIEIVKLLLDNQAEIDQSSNAGWTSLMQASCEGHKDIVEVLIKRKADIHIKNKKGWTAFMLASQNGKTEVAKLLLDRGAFINDKNKSEVSALLIASKGGYLSIIQLLMSRGAFFYTDNKYNPLSIAIKHKHKNLIVPLIQSYHQCLKKGDKITTLFSVLKLKDKDILKSLLTYYEIDESFIDGEKTPLMKAIEMKDNEMVQVILKAYPPHVNRKNKLEFTPLMLAAKDGQIEIVQLLLDNNADIEALNSERWNALMYATQGGHKKIVELLINKEATVNQKEKKYGMTSLMIASQKGFIEIVELLVNKGAKINEKSNEGWTALMYAGEKGFNEIVTTLIKGGGNIDEQNLGSETVLMIAISNGECEVIKTLFQYGVDCNKLNKKNNSALYFVCISKEKDIQNLILSTPYLSRFKIEEQQKVFKYAVQQQLSSFISIFFQLHEDYFFSSDCQIQPFLQSLIWGWIKKTDFSSVSFFISQVPFEKLLYINAFLDYYNQQIADIKNVNLIQGLIDTYQKNSETFFNLLVRQLSDQEKIAYISKFWDLKHYDLACFMVSFLSLSFIKKDLALPFSYNVFQEEIDEQQSSLIFYSFKSIQFFASLLKRLSPQDQELIDLLANHLPYFYPHYQTLYLLWKEEEVSTEMIRNFFRETIQPIEDTSLLRLLIKILNNKPLFSDSKKLFYILLDCYLETPSPYSYFFVSCSLFVQEGKLATFLLNSSCSDVNLFKQYMIYQMIDLMENVGRLSFSKRVYQIIIIPHYLKLLNRVCQPQNKWVIEEIAKLSSIYSRLLCEFSIMYNYPECLMPIKLSSDLWVNLQTTIMNLLQKDPSRSFQTESSFLFYWVLFIKNLNLSQMKRTSIKQAISQTSVSFRLKILNQTIEALSSPLYKIDLVFWGDICQIKLNESTLWLSFQMKLPFATLIHFSLCSYSDIYEVINFIYQKKFHASHQFLNSFDNQTVDLTNKVLELYPQGHSDSLPKALSTAIFMRYLQFHPVNQFSLPSFFKKNSFKKTGDPICFDSPADLLKYIGEQRYLKEFYWFQRFYRRNPYQPPYIDTAHSKFINRSMKLSREEDYLYITKFLSDNQERIRESIDSLSVSELKSQWETGLGSILSCLAGQIYWVKSFIEPSFPEDRLVYPISKDTILDTLLFIIYLQRSSIVKSLAEKNVYLFMESPQYYEGNSTHYFNYIMIESQKQFLNATPFVDIEPDDRLSSSLLPRPFIEMFFDEFTPIHYVTQFILPCLNPLVSPSELEYGIAYNIPKLQQFFSEVLQSLSFGSNWTLDSSDKEEFAIMDLGRFLETIVKWEGSPIQHSGSGLNLQEIPNRLCVHLSVNKLTIKSA